MLPFIHTPIVDFLGCSKDLVAIHYATLKTANHQLDPKLVWQEIQTGGISRQTMKESLEEIGIRYDNLKLRLPHFVFYISNTSLNCTKQILTEFADHHLSDVQETFDVMTYFTGMEPPREVLNNTEFNKNWHQIEEHLLRCLAICKSENLDSKLVEPLLPATATFRIIFSTDFKTLQSFLEQGLCEKTEVEIKSLSWQIYDQMTSEFPKLSRRLGLSCWGNSQLYCNESIEIYRKCRFGNGNRPHKQDFLKFLKSVPLGNHGAQPSNSNLFSP